MANTPTPQMNVKTWRAKRRSAIATTPMRLISTVDATKTSNRLESIELPSSSGTSIHDQPQSTMTSSLNTRSDLVANSTASSETRCGKSHTADT
jgi:hypothetical protein